MELFSQSSVYKRKSSRGTSFASEGKTEDKEKLKHDQDKAEGVSWSFKYCLSLKIEWSGIKAVLAKPRSAIRGLLSLRPTNLLTGFCPVSRMTRPRQCHSSECCT